MSHHHDVVLVHLWPFHIQPCIGVVLVEGVVGIVAFIQISQGDGGAPVFIHAHMIAVHPVLLHKPLDGLPHTVVSCLRNHGDRQAHPSQRDESVERRTTRHGSRRLFVSENDVENRLSYSNYLSHDLKINVVNPFPSNISRATSCKRCGVTFSRCSMVSFIPSNLL